MLIQTALIGFVLLFGLCFIVFGFSQLLLGIRTIVHDIRVWVDYWQSAGWETTRGTITRSVLTRNYYSRRIKTIKPAIAFSYSVDGQTYTSTQYMFRAWWHEGAQPRTQPPLGADVTVYYNPRNPRSATLDRGRPAVSPALCFQMLMLAYGPLFIWLGAYVAIGPLNDPPSFAADELPSIAQQSGGALVGLGSVSLLVAWCRRRHAERRCELLRRLESATPVRAADAVRNRAIAIFGRAESSEAGPIVSPLTGEPVFYYRARIDWGREPVERVGHHKFCVRDETGRVQVDTQFGTDRLATNRPKIDAKMQKWIDCVFADLMWKPDPCRVSEAHIAPGDSVLVVGELRRVRRGEFALCAVPDDSLSLIFAAAPLPEMLRRLNGSATRRRALIRCAAAALLVGIALLVA
ncbi:MAG: DUF3592 domain-containing protein [Planctomycetota bacterium]